jgi:hypothetical protein
VTVTMPAPLQQAQAEVDHLTQTYEGLRNGTLHWSAWRDDLTCPDRAGVALEECWSALRLAEEELARQTGGNQ